MSTNSDSSIRLVRNATLLVTMGETTFLVDPIFASPGENPSVPNSPNDRRNPLVPMPDIELSYDAVVVTHRHPDHFDEAAKAALDADVPLCCQPAEVEAFADEGFTDVRPVDDEVSFDGITIHRTPGRHIAGDTIWYDAVERTLDRFDPDTVVLNGGEAQFNEGRPITMGVEDVVAVRDATDATVAVVHMEAINHCLLSRDELRAETDDVRVPEDGELIPF